MTAPAGWRDVTRAVSERSGAALDVAYDGPVGGGLAANLNIVRRDAERAPLTGLARRGQAEVDDLAGGRLDFTRLVPLRVDRALAVRYEFATDADRVRQVGVLHEGSYYVITLTAPRPAFRRAVPRLDGLLRSWRWD